MEEQNMPNAIIAVMEQQQGKWNRMSWEALAAAQQIAAALGAPVEAVVIGTGVRALADEAAAAKVARVRLLDDSLLEPYTPDGFVAARVSEPSEDRGRQLMGMLSALHLSY